MDWLLTDSPSVILEGAVLVVVLMSVTLGSIARTRAASATNRVAKVYWADLGTIAWVWSGAAGITLAGSLADVEGLRMPIWLGLDLVVAVILAVVVQRRWRALSLLRGVADKLAPVGTPQRRITSTSWEIGLLGAGAGSLLLYMGAVSHGFGHPIHWLIAALGVALGYVVGLAVATPRYSVSGRSEA